MILKWTVTLVKLLKAGKEALVKFFFKCVQQAEMFPAVRNEGWGGEQD